jgi:hypothetical protein
MDELNEYIFRVHRMDRDPEFEKRKKCMDIQRKLLQISRDKFLPVLGVTVYPGTLTVIAKTELNVYYLWWYPQVSTEPLIKIGDSDGKCVYNGSWKVDDDVKNDATSLQE